MSPTPRRSRLALLGLLAALASSLLACKPDDDDDSTTPDPGAAEVIEDLVYAGEAGGSTLRGDLYLPERDAPPPVFVLFHGGGFFQGERADLEVAAGHLQRDGVAVFNVDYRLVGVDGGEFPAAAVDALDAVRYLNTNREELGIAGACGAFGTSAGGTLASLTVLLRDDPLMVRAGWPALRGQSDDVPVLASTSGIYDFSTREEQHGSVPPMEQDFLGGSPQDQPERYQFASPIQHVGDARGPVLLLHGEQDALVEPIQAELMRDALDGVEVDVELQTYPDGIHGFMFPINEHNPEGLDALDRLAAFLTTASPLCPAIGDIGSRRVVQSGSATWDGQTWSGNENYQLKDAGQPVCEREFSTAGETGEGSPPVARVTYALISESGDCADAPYLPADGEVWSLIAQEDSRDGVPALFRESEGLGRFRWFDLLADGDDLVYEYEASLPDPT